mmetsp:Transcript_20511/g.42971  ORF Transcript_20511/g.42971 Transcript_20511/m.42971 type:complete len:372 (-) Transcript_20511:338-1453(-)
MTGEAWFFLFILEGGFRFGNVHGGDNVAKFRHAFGISGFIVIPGINFDERAINDLRRQGIHNGGSSIIGVIGRHEWFGFKSQNALERSFQTRLFQGGIDFFHSDGLFDFKDTIGDTGIEQGNADGQTIEFALEFGINFDNGGRGSSGGGAQVAHSGTSTTQIRLFGVGHVHQSLSSSDIMNGGDASMYNTKVFLNHLDNRGQAVGGTRGVGDQFLGFLTLEQTIVASQHHIQGSGFLDGGTDHHLLDTTGIKVGLQSGDLEEFTSTFHDHFHSHAGEINLGKVLFLREGDDLAVDGEGFAIFRRFHLFLPSAMHRVVLHQVGGGFATAQIIHVHNFEFDIIPSVLETETTDTTKAIDGALDGGFLFAKHFR